MIFSHNTIHFASKSNDSITEHTIVHIKTAFPYNLSCINAKFISLLNMVIKQSSQQIICRSNGMEISCKMKI